MDSDDRKDVEAFRNGDQDAAQRLYDRYAAQLLARVRSALANVNGRGGLDSEGITLSGIASFLSAVKKPKFNPAAANVVGLLVTIVHRKCCVALRRKRGVFGFDPEQLNAIVADVISSTSVAESIQEFEVRRNELIRKATAEFTALEQRILGYYLDETNEFSRDDIAKACDCSVSKVKATIELFEARLRRLLDDET